MNTGSREHDGATADAFDRDVAALGHALCDLAQHALVLVRLDGVPHAVAPDFVAHHDKMPCTIADGANGVGDAGGTRRAALVEQVVGNHVAQAFEQNRRALDARVFSHLPEILVAFDGGESLSSALGAVPLHAFLALPAERAHRSKVDAATFKPHAQGLRQRALTAARSTGNQGHHFRSTS
ncbi:MAG: DUF1826 domain-containing protein [Eggerthellaceae bacterium]|nr:DUF1826 domain-containing protein [Eggerthellaceae bacterium]